MIILLKQCKFYQTIQLVEDQYEEMVLFCKCLNDFFSLLDLGIFAAKTKSKRKIANISIQSAIHQDFMFLYESSVEPIVFNSSSNLENLSVVKQFCDVIFKVKQTLFFGHKAFFCSRIEYFRAFLHENHFSEMSETIGDLPVFPVNNISALAFSELCKFTYANQSPVIRDYIACYVLN